MSETEREMRARLEAELAATRAPDDDEVAQMERMAARARAEAARLRRIEREQTGSIRGESKRKAKRKQAKAARKRAR